MAVYGPPPPPPNAGPVYGPPPAESRLSPSDISRTLATNRRKIKECWTRGKGNGTSARVTLRLTIQSDGRVSQPSISASDAPQQVNDCILDVARTMRFPRSETTITVSLPLLFKDD